MGYIEPIDQEDYQKIQILNCCKIIASKEVPEFLEFIEWLKKNYRNNPINYATSHQKIKEIVTQFCLELKYDNDQQFSKEVINWLFPTYIHKVVNLLLIEIYPRTEKSIISLGLSKFIERYETIHFHSIFLFGKNNNFSAFIKDYGEDLHYLTDQYMDIYYSQYDMKKHNATAYQIRDLFRNLYVEISHIPAFIIWKDSLTNSHVISLEGLSHQQMFDVVKHITSGIENKKSLDEVSQIGRDKVKSYLSSPNQPIIEVKTVTEQINIGTMTGSNLVTGTVVGTVSTYNNVIPEQNSQELKLTDLLTQLQEAIAKTPESELNERRRNKALGLVNELAEAAKDPTNESNLDKADNAILNLNGIVAEMPKDSTSTQTINKLILAIKNYFKP